MPSPAAVLTIPASVIGFPLPPLGPGMPIVGAPTVMIEGKVAAHVGSLIKPHGNPKNPKMPGFNPTCAAAVITPIGSSPNVMVEGKFLGRIGSKCSCGQHFVTLGAPTVMVGP
jgi:uncharacterized Zn-binding protein involved in type VI secretion